MTQSKVIELIKLQLEKLNIQIEREYKTGDDSLFLRLKGKFSVDIFPDGVIVLIERGHETVYSEFSFGQLDELFKQLAK